jgi:hypothetical protein
VAVVCESGDKGAAFGCSTWKANAMKIPEQVTDTELGAGGEPWLGGGLLPEGNAQLERLYGLLDKPWFCHRHNVLFELRESGPRQMLCIMRGGALAATWTSEGQTLVFCPAGDGAEERAETLNCAISVTCDFLDHVRVKPKQASAAAPLVAH